MSTTTMLLVPLLVLAVVSVLAFAGCASFDAAAPETVTPGPQNGGVDPIAPYPKAVLATGGLRSYWRLGEPASSAQAEDIAPGVATPGSYSLGVTRGQTGALTKKAGGDDKAATFDGTTGYVEVAYNGNNNPTMAFTVEAWIQPQLTQPGTVTVLSSCDPVAFTGFVLEVRRTNAGAQFAVARMGDGTKFNRLDVELGPATANNGWHYVAMTYDMTTEVLSLLTHDGASLFSKTTPGLGYVALPLGAGKPLRIGAGRSSDTVSPPPGDPARAFFKGGIDEVALYDQALKTADSTSHLGIGLTA